MRWIARAAAIDLALTGLFLIVSPVLFGWLILDAEPAMVGQVLGRIAGAAMFGFGLATWPASVAEKPSTSAIRALLIFNLLATLSLGSLGISGRFAGILLWPAVALHAGLALLLGRAWLAGEK